MIMKNYYYDEYKKYNYWNQRFIVGPNNKKNEKLALFWYYNYYYPYKVHNIKTKGYLKNKYGLYLGKLPNSY